MNDIIAYTLFALYILAQMLMACFFLVWTIDIGVWFIGAMPAVVLLGNCIIGIHGEVTSRD